MATPAGNGSQPQSATDRVNLWRRRWEYCRRYYEPLHARIERELRFSLKLQHYLNDQGLTLDRRRIQFKGRELFSKIRREVADVMRAMATSDVSAVPVETAPGSQDPITAETAEWAVKQDLRHPEKGFDTYLERMVLGAISARMWGMAVDWEESASPYGEALFRNVDPTKIHLCPPFTDVWDLRLPYVIEQIEMRVADAQRMEGWTNAKLLHEDPLPPHPTTGQVQIDEQNRVSLWNEPEAEPGRSPKGMCVILLCWSRFDPTTKAKIKDTRALEPEKQYTACTTCGWRSEPGAQGDEICPDCLSRGGLNTAHLIQVERIEEDVLQFKRGKRMEIIAPLQSLMVRDGG